MGRRRRVKMPKSVQRRIQETLREGELIKHGYRMRASATARHRALAKAVREDGGLTVHKRLILLYTWNKNDDPDLARIARADANWVKKKYYGTSLWR